MESKEVFVQAHVRIIKQRAYRFVCKQCLEVVERICYPSQPKYCEQCRPPKSTSKTPSTAKLVKSKKKLPITVSNDREMAVGE